VTHPSVIGLVGRSGAVLAVSIVASVIATSCTTATDETGSRSTAELESDASRYPAAMSEICEATTTKLAALLTPSDAISRADWAGEVSRIFTEQAAAFDSIGVVDGVADDVSTNHLTLIETTTEQAAQWSALSTALGDETASAAIGDIGADITALTLGRNELVDTMNLPACRAIGAET
jgi:hypothetical protein